MKCNTYIFLSVFCCTFFSAQKDGVALPPKTAVLDTVLITQKGFVESDSVLKNPYVTDNQIAERNFPAGFQRKYRGDEFSYETVKPRESFWSRVRRQLKKHWESIFGKPDPKASLKAMEIILWLLAILSVAVVLYYGLNYLVNRQGNILFGRKNRKIDIQSSDITENIHEINFPENILKYEKEGNYRSAVRYQFLFVLKKISDSRIISWNPEKTNKDYLAEIKNSDLKAQFAELVRIFDYVWYGEFEISEENYGKFREKFTGFKW